MLEKYPGERVAFYIDCTALLGAAESITGTPTVDSYPKFTGSAALTIETATVNSEQVVLSDGTQIAAGKLVTMMVSNGQSTTDVDARTYSVLVTFSTNAGNTLVAKSLLSVLPVGPT